MNQKRHCAVRYAVLALLIPLFCMSLPSSGSGSAATIDKAPGQQAVIIASTFVHLLAKGKFAAAEHYLSPKMQSAIPEAALKDTWQEILARYGRFNHQLATQSVAHTTLPTVAVPCVFTRAVLDIVFTFNLEGKITGFHIVHIRSTSSYESPSYVHPETFHEQLVTVGSAPWKLEGMLTIPKGRGPWPAVVLVQGSGATDRDETIPPNKPFRDLARGLASQGIAVLRYDKRTFIYGAQITALTTFTLQAETITDAVAAAKLLETIRDINPKRIYVLGHSLGGFSAPRIAEQDPHIAGLILLGGPSRSLEDTFLDQIIYLHSIGYQTASDVAAARQAVANVKTLTSTQKATKKLLPLHIPPSYWLDLHTYNQVRVAYALKQPMLILQAARDYQVTLVDFNGWKAGLKGRKDVTFKVYPNLFHLFMSVVSRSKGLATPAEYNHPGHIDVQVIMDIVHWIAQAPSISS